MTSDQVTARCQSALQVPIHRPATYVASASMSGLALTLVALGAATLGFWRLGADPGWTGPFFISDGLLSRYHWWFALAIGSQTSAFILNRWVASQNIKLSAQARLET